MSDWRWWLPKKNRGGIDPVDIYGNPLWGDQSIQDVYGPPVPSNNQALMAHVPTARDVLGFTVNNPQYVQPVPDWAKLHAREPNANFAPANTPIRQAEPYEPFALAASMPFPTVTKGIVGLAKNERPDIRWYEPAFDIASAAGGGGGAVLKGLGAAGKLLAPAAATVGTAGMTASNWDKSGAGGKAFNLAVTALAAYGLRGAAAEAFLRLPPETQDAILRTAQKPTLRPSAAMGITPEGMAPREIPVTQQPKAEDVITPEETQQALTKGPSELPIKGIPWRQAFDETNDVFRKEAILRAIADGRATPQELVDVWNRTDGLPEESNIRWAVVHKAKLLTPEVLKEYPDLATASRLSSDDVWQMTHPREEPSVPAGQARTTTPIIPETPNVPPVGTGGDTNMLRKPIWADIAGQPPEPPKPPTAVGGSAELPSGRQPGGIHNQVPAPDVDPLQQLTDALTPDKKPLRARASNFLDEAMRRMYDPAWDLGPLSKETGIPAHQLYQVTSGAPAYGENLVRKYVRPIVASVGKDVDALEQYMVLKRSEDILARNPQAVLPGGIDGWQGVIKAQQSLEEKLGSARMANVRAAAEQMWNVNKDYVLGPLRDEGIISPQTYRDLVSAHPHYIDFHRADFSVVDTVDNIMRRPTASLSSNTLKAMELEGSTRKLDHPLARAETQVVRTQMIVSRNRAAKGIVAALQESEKATGKKLVVPVGEKAEHSILTDTISYFDKGNKITVQVPREFAVAAKNLDAETANAVTNFISKLNMPLRMGATTYNPAFLIINPIRDAMSAWFREGLIPLSGDYIKGMAAAVTKNSTFDEAARSGVLMSGLVETQKSTSALAQAAGRGALTVHNPKDILTIIPRLINEGNVAMERGTRIATYIKLRNKGVGELEAAVRSRDVTVDFSKAGSTMRLINQIIPFSNAGLQGTANVIRTMRYNPKWALLAATPLAAASVAAYVNNLRFPDSYNLIPQYESRGNWVFQVGEGTDSDGKTFPIYIKFPKGPMGAALTAPAEIALRLADKHNDRSVVEQFLSAGQGVLEQTSPVTPTLSGVTPPILSTGIGVATNQDPYSGLPIVPQGEQGRLPEQRFGQDNSAIAVEVGKKFQVSPRLIDFALRNYGAGAATATNWLASMGLEALGVKPQIYGAVGAKAPGTAQEIAKAPVTGRFVGVKATGESSQQWDNLQSLYDKGRREFYANPEMVRLGVGYGKVGDSINGIDITGPERMGYQGLVNQYVQDNVNKLMGSMAYWTLTDGQKKKAVTDAVSQARSMAGDHFLSYGVGKDEIRRRQIQKKMQELAPADRVKFLTTLPEYQVMPYEQRQAAIREAIASR